MVFINIGNISMDDLYISFHLIFIQKIPHTASILYTKPHEGLLFQYKI